MEGIGFLKTDEDFMASVELIANYQDKNNYNAALLDEEKKELTNYLLTKVKSSFNENIRLYDKNAELIAYIYKDSNEYKLNFISYENSKKILYSKYESQNTYEKQTYQESEVAPFEHADYYTQPELKKGALTTYHYKDNNIYISSHGSIFSQDDLEENLVHIEMTKLFDDSYFKKISNDLDTELSHLI